MRMAFRCFVAAALILGLALPVLADIRPPFPVKPPQTGAVIKPPNPNPNPVPLPVGTALGSAKVTINPDMQAREPKILIGKKLLQNQRTDTGQPEGNPAATTDEAPRPKMHTIVAGVSLAMALCFAGLWLVRFGGGMKGKSLGVFLGMVALLGVAGYAYANAAPPRTIGQPPQTGQPQIGQPPQFGKPPQVGQPPQFGKPPFQQGPTPVTFSTAFKVELVEGDTVTIVLTQQQMMEMMRGGNQQPNPFPGPNPGPNPNPFPIQPQNPGINPGVLPVQGQPVP